MFIGVGIITNENHSLIWNYPFNPKILYVEPFEDWPIDGGDQIGQLATELIITGHEDGQGLCKYILYKALCRFNCQ